MKSGLCGCSYGFLPGALNIGAAAEAAAMWAQASTSPRFPASSRPRHLERQAFVPTRPSDFPQKPIATKITRSIH